MQSSPREQYVKCVIKKSTVDYPYTDVGSAWFQVFFVSVSLFRFNIYCIYIYLCNYCFYIAQG